MKETTNTLRKKIWQIASSYHCSLIGVCLGRKELRQMKKRKVYRLSPTDSDYSLHNTLSAISRLKSPQSRALHKVLDAKYRLAVKRYTPLRCSSDILAQWGDDFAAGDIAGPYWAIMTHPLTDGEIIRRIYGDCHMRSFDGFAEQKQENARLKKSREANRRLQNQLESMKEKLTRQQGKYSAARQAGKEQRAEVVRLQHHNRQLQQENEQLVARCLPVEKHAAINPVEQQLLVARQQVKEYEQALIKLQGECLEAEKRLESLSQLNFQQQEALEESRRQQREQKEEIESLEAMLTGQLVPDPACDECGDNCSCPVNQRLSGRRVLYVGGHHKMIPHYRQMVEMSGGQFVHHDGGRESSKQQLPRLLSGVDAVFCPLDCVSHYACKCVKKICKRSSTPFVMMRSSGLSSLAKGLEKISREH